MDKNAIKKYAVWARRELISRVTQRAALYEITEEKITDASADSVRGRVLSSSEKRQRQALIAQIKAKDFKQVMEEIAYTWFNRFIALRFMEVNQYLPSHVRVFTDDEGAFRPQILSEAIDLELDGLDKGKVYALKTANDDDALFKYLIIVQCNALSEILPGMFQRIEDYTELLFPDNLLRAGSVIEQMVTSIPEEDWTDQVQIIGWLYQYYNTEPKDQVFADLKKNIKITKEKIPAATQLFTPDWIVRYMVENSLGRLWVEGHPAAKEKFLPEHNEDGSVCVKEGRWNYYLEEAEQEPEAEAQLAQIRKGYAAMTPEQLRVIDPCCGSGHILVYLFDVLVQIYEDYGYTAREAASSIVKNNLWGLDIDQRAAQLSYFSVMMKARQYDRRFFSRGLQPHVIAIAESNNADREAVDYFCKGDRRLKKAMQTVITELHDAKEFGSILTCTPQDWDALYARFGEVYDEISLQREETLALLPLVRTAEALSQQYDVVVTNPPYMGSSGMDKKLFNYVKKNYDDGRNDLYTAFILRCHEYAKENRYIAMITQQGWLGLTRSAQLRGAVYSKATFINMLHLGAKAFEDISGEVVQTAAFVLSKNTLVDYTASYSKLIDFGSSSEKETAYLRHLGIFFATIRETQAISGHPLSYWLPRRMLQIFQNREIGDYFDCRCGMATGDNDRFIRFWYEPAKHKLTHFSPNSKWALYNKGGSQRRWYGNYDLVVNWENNGFDIKENKRKRLERGEIEKKNSECWNSEYYFREGITWSAISSGVPMFRYDPRESLFDTKGPTCFCVNDTSEKEMLCLMGFLNSSVAESVLSVLAPTLDCNPGIVAKLPYRLCNGNQPILTAVKMNMELSKADWDSFETSWDFQRHPLVVDRREYQDQMSLGFNSQARRESVSLLSKIYENWKDCCDERFSQLKANEEELNRIFIDIYGLQDELTPEVEDKDVTVRKAELQREIRSLISYAVGCMFGRYSIYKPGLLFAGEPYSLKSFVDKLNDQPGVISQEQLEQEYRTNGVIFHEMLEPDADNIIPICDDEYFKDDIAGRFVRFIEEVYGEETLEQNLRFIADALGGKGSPRDVIRSYFLNDFYPDHLKIYQKRPIYWLFDSGKKNGFKCLIYMHRYQPDTIARIRTDYVHEQQSRYRTAIADLEARAAAASTSERVKLNKQLQKLRDQAEELRVYEEKIHHLADQMIPIDLDDGVKVNYAKFQDVLAKIK